MMKKIMPLILIYIFSVGCQSQSNSKKNQPESSNLQILYSDKEIINWVNKKVDSVLIANNIPAISLGIIKNGKVILSEGFGYANRKTKVKVNENSIYQIASDTKKMTGIIVRNLVSEKKLNIDESILNYLPSLLKEDAKLKLRDVTLRHLLYHESGIPNRAPSNKRIDGEPMLIPYTEDDLIYDLNTINIDEIEAKFNYSNFGYAIVGYICERASGKSYSELIKKYVSGKYDMPNTTIYLSNNQLKSLLVTPYRKEDRNKETQPFTMGKLSSAGGVYSNISDLSKLMIKQIEAYRAYNKTKSLSNFLILTENSGIEGNDYGFGLGKKVFETGVQYGHGGDLDGYASSYVFSPEYSSGVIILSSSGGRWVGELEKEILFKLTNRKYTLPKKSIAQEFYNIISEIGFEKGKEWFEKNKNSDTFYINNQEMDNVGYALIKNKKEDAIKVFKWNTILFPKSPGAFSSLGEIYLKNGDKKLALKNYKISIKLDPENINIKNIIDKLENTIEDN